MGAGGSGNGAQRKVTCWAGSGRLRVVVVRLAGAHRVWANHMGVPSGVESAFLVTDGGGVVGRGYFASIDELAEVVDLAALTPR